MLFIASVLFAAALSNNPVAPALEGLVQCYEPNDQKRTCRSIAAYHHIEGALYDNTATVLISASGPVVLETITPVRVSADAVCGQIKAEDILKGKVQVGGKVLTDSEASPLLERIAKAMAPMIGKEICTAYVPSGSDIIAKATIDGTYQPDADQRVKWIKPTDGYTVAP